MVLLRRISVALTAAVAALGSVLFMALSHFYRRRVWSSETDYCAIREEEVERSERQVLVLGLDGAGKSSVMLGLTGSGRRHCRPTRGFNFMSLDMPACQLDFLEIGGGEDLRRYWAEYLRKTHVLVYVVDSSDRQRLPLARDELHRLLQAGGQLPVIVLGNKQDKPDAVSVSQLHEALSLGGAGGGWRLHLLTSRLGTDGLHAPHSLQAVRDLLLQLV